MHTTHKRTVLVSSVRSLLGQLTARRLALGMVLLSGRPILLLDEPTAALDRAGRSLILNLLDRSCPGTAMMIASHDRSFLEAAGCRILILGPEGLSPSMWGENPATGTGP